MAVQWGHYVSQREWNRGQFGGVSDVSNYLCANGSHFIPAWTDVIQHGFVKYYEKAQRLLEALDPNDPESIDKRIFYTGILEVLEAIRRCQPDTLTPIEAMSLIYEWKQKLN